MKTVRIDNGVVIEIVPEYALPVEKWYGVEFASRCVTAPDEVDQNWFYDAETGEFFEYKEPEPVPEAEPTAEELLDIMLGVNRYE